MQTFTRRRFLVSSAAAAASFRAVAQQPRDTTAPVPLTIDTHTTVAHVPENFIGLSYEIEQLRDASFFAATNTGLIAQFRALAPHGVLRLGGNTSDVGWWKPTAMTTAPEMHIRETTGEPAGKLAYSIEPTAVRNLRGFLDATGWTCLFGINLGTNTPARAADEAVVVARELGAKLEYFQLGNEPDLFARHMRDPKTWSADAYFDEWLAMANAIRARVPHARFGLPDTSGNPQWYAEVVKRLIALAPADRPAVAMLSHHYYFGGPPANPQVNVPRLLHHDAKVDKLANDIRAAATELSGATHTSVPYRMTEGNTCYRGGKPGVSDVFAATLWAADYCLTLASDGYAGVNLHGGGGKEVANSLGGTLPGEELMPDPKAPHARPFYTPIADIDGKYVAEPVFYGLLFAQHFAGAELVKIDFAPGDINATAYAGKLPGGKQLVAIINKDEARGIAVQLPRFTRGRVGSLSAASLEARQVQWTGMSTGAKPLARNGVLNVPAASAVLVELS